MTLVMKDKAYKYRIIWHVTLRLCNTATIKLEPVWGHLVYARVLTAHKKINHHIRVSDG